MNRRQDEAELSAVDLSTQVGSVLLDSPILTAAGTSGHGAELAAYFDLSELGAVVVKSLSIDAWPGNPPLRVTGVAAGMLNSVGLQGPGVAAWLENDLPKLEATGAKVVTSIWGRRIEEFARAAELLGGASDCVVAIEVNVSCPNLDDRSAMFGHSAQTTAEVIEACQVARRPLWAKLSPNVADLVAIADATHRAGAEALTLVNTLLGMSIDLWTRRPVLGAGRGGLSGHALHPVAVRAVFDVHEALAEVPIVGVGGVFSGEEAIEFLLAGASAVEVGTATFLDPHAPLRVLRELRSWCHEEGISSLGELIGAGHD